MSLCSIKQKETIMKKTYINPAMEIVKIETHKMLAESFGVSNVEVNGSAALGRDYDFDDED